MPNGSTRLVVALAGSLGSGKTTVARGLQALGFVPFKFSAVLQRLMNQSGTDSRGDLQAFGAAYISKHGLAALVRALWEEAQGHELVVVDGVRHVEVKSLLVEFAQCPVKLVFLDSAQNVRLVRLQARGQYQGEQAMTLEELEALEGAATEREIPMMPNQSDLVVDADRDSADVMGTVVEAVQSWLEESVVPSTNSGSR